MTCRRTSAAVLVLLLTSLWLGGASAAENRSVLRDSTYARSVLANNPSSFAWFAFLALCSPLDGSAPKLFETWRPSSEVYLKNGNRPLPWGDTPSIPSQAQAYAMREGIPSSTIWHNLDSYVQVDGLPLKDDFMRNVRYELYMNEDALSYVLEKQVYNANGQAALTANLSFPETAYELKTSWIWIESGDEKAYAELSPHYFIAHAYYETETGYNIGRAALTGMHIISKIQPNWVWVTFENDKNGDYTKASYELPIPPSAVQANQTHQSALKAQGSIFANYRLNGVQLDFNSPKRLANSQIESAFQSDSSCITCHSVAASKAQPSFEWFSVVDADGGGIQYYTGMPPDKKLEGWTRLDFVWSLRRAQWSR
ncbi:MAG: hypothetical protein O2960_15855 [Verrucomicrobia bacterium]|nr:hypothetical protein [Verrucomicrobiota bacterium]